MSTILGGIIYGPVAGTCTNIGAAIATGLFAGIFSSFFFQKIYPKLNQGGIKDTFGLTSVWIISLLATFVISPAVVAAYYNNGIALTTF
jgi:uncharacterized membrane protein YdjX (TVP38/TMEM64 family)